MFLGVEAMKYKTISGNGQTIHIAICYKCGEVLDHCGSRAQKYCTECKKEVDKEKARERMRKYRAKKGVKKND